MEGQEDFSRCSNSSRAGKVLSLVLDQYHARVKHKEPFSRCCLSGDHFFGGSFGGAHQAVCHVPVTPTAPPGGPQSSCAGAAVQALGATLIRAAQPAGSWDGAHLQGAPTASVQSGSEHQGPGALFKRKERRLQPELQAQSRSLGFPGQVKKAGKVTHSVTRWCI